jgi:cell division protein FtsW
MGKRFSLKQKPFDKPFFWITVILLALGLLSFVSASLGILAGGKSKFFSLLMSQLVFGIGIGSVGFLAALHIPYKLLRRHAFYIFIFGVALTLLVFVPGLGYEHGGARRWLDLGPVSFQPVEFLKIAFVIYFAAWLSWVRGKVKDFRYGILPFAILLGALGFILLRQPDTKSLILMFVSAVAMLFLSGIPWKYLFATFGIGAVLFGGLLVLKPDSYLVGRIKTFLDPSRDPQGASWQLQQAWIAIGSGGVTGRGLGQSVQKFTYLPEPHGDSIFAVIGEEFGFVGTSIFVILYVLFALRGLRIAYRAPDLFGRLLVTGLVILLVAQSFMNIASIIGLFPLTGVPLVFVSHGGTSLMFALISVGLILNISRYQIKLK